MEGETPEEEAAAVKEWVAARETLAGHQPPDMGGAVEGEAGTNYEYPFETERVRKKKKTQYSILNNANCAEGWAKPKRKMLSLM